VAWHPGGPRLATGDHKNFSVHVQTFADSMPIRETGGRRHSPPEVDSASPRRSSIKGLSPSFGPLPAKKCLRAEQLFQNRCVQMASSTEPHTLDCLTHSANAPQIRKPTSGNDLQGGSTVMSFRIPPLSVDLASSGQTQHVPELDEEQGSDNTGDSHSRQKRIGDRWLRRLSKREEARTAA
jgi:hypothetical protein